MEAFIRAIQENNLEEVRRLINDPYVDINQVIIDRQHQLLTPLSEAVSNNYYDITKFLLKNGAKVNVHKLSRPILISAIINENNDITELLLEYGADVNVSDRSLATPLHYATLFDNIKIVKLLLKHGANLDDTDEIGDTPLKIALINDLIDIAEDLIQHGAEIPDFDDDLYDELSDEAKDLLENCCIDIKEPC